MPERGSPFGARDLRDKLELWRHDYLPLRLSQTFGVPCRNIHAAGSPSPARIAAKDSFAAMLYDFLDVRSSNREPGMPWIKHLCTFGHMGFVALACAIGSARIYR